MEQSKYFGDTVDRDLALFCARLLAGELRSSEFTALVEGLWDRGRFLLQTSFVHRTLQAVYGSLSDRCSAEYGLNVQAVEFTSKWMTPDSAEVPAIFIEAPAEAKSAAQGTNDLNRPLHTHPSARAAFVVEGSAEFYFVHREGPDRCLRALPVSAGDVLFWPADVEHTFNAYSGFSLVSVLGNREGHAHDGYARCCNSDIDLGLLSEMRIARVGLDTGPLEH